MTDGSSRADRVAVLIPCYNEEKTVTRVIESFRQQLPTASVFVYDNNSTDKTAELARAAGAFVYRELQQGKGNVVRRMFADVDADIYVLVDGDDTYDATSVTDMIALLRREALDLVTGCRVTEIKSAYRTGHRFGNRMLSGLVAAIFGRGTNDLLSGYRVLSRRFVKSFPALSRGFEIETELTVHSQFQRMHGEFGFDLEAPGQSRKALDEAPRQYPVTR